jgi:tetrahydromethanopterin S-methyltransferase subunit F
MGTLSYHPTVKSGLANQQNHHHDKDNDGGNGGGNSMESRVAKLEADVEHIKNSLKDIKDDVREIKRDARVDFRLLFGAIIATTLGLAGIMAKGFHWF